MSRRARIALTVTAVGLSAVIALLALAPADQGGPHGPAAAALQAELVRTAPGRAHAVLDLDALEHNADAIRAAVPDGIELRLVSKSLPSMPLLAHLMDHLGTDRLMVFSEPFLDATLRAFGRRVDLLLGKPLPAAAARRLMTAHDTGRVCWLIDDLPRLDAYLAVAQQRGQAARVCVELDVGLRRGGARDIAALDALLTRIASHPDALSLGGLMGYDGHVPHAPPVIADSDDEFARVQQRYGALVDAARATHPALFAGHPIIDGGGSGTYARYTDDLTTPVNELSIGSAFLAPAHFPAARAAGLEPALLLAAPVLKRLDEPRLPFADAMGPLMAWWNPNHAVHFFLLGGGWPADPASPPGITRNPLWTDDGVINLLPNQPLFTGSASVPLRPGDMIFFDPWQGDAMVALAALTVLRRGRVVERWPTYRGGD